MAATARPAGGPAHDRGRPSGFPQARVVGLLCTNHVVPGVMAPDNALAGGLVVRRVNRVDLPDVLRIKWICFSESWPYPASKMFVDELAFLAAAHGNEVLDYVVADVVPNHGNDISHVKDLAVRPEARRNGLGRQLLVQSLTVMAIAGAAVVELEVRISNDPAVGPYQSLGFEPTRRVPSHCGDDEDAYVMILDMAGWQRA